jgi:hypothetical protein
MFEYHTVFSFVLQNVSNKIVSCYLKENVKKVQFNIVFFSKTQVDGSLS